MAYFKITYFVHDETNPGVIYRLDAHEAKEMVICGRGKLRDNDLNIKVETPKEWLDSVEKNENPIVSSKDADISLEELQKMYVEKFNKQLAPAYRNNVEWIKNKLYS